MPEPESRAAVERVMAAVEQRYRSGPSWRRDFRREGPILRQLLLQFVEKYGRQFQLEGVLGSIGSTAVVFKLSELVGPAGGSAEQSLRVPRAMKLVRPRAGVVERLAKLIRAEAEKLYKLRHANLVQVMLFGELEHANTSYPFFVMEYLEGVCDAAEYFEAEERPLGHLLEVVRQLASALAYLHESGVVHCDVKPSNILVAHTPHGVQARLSDLGYAHYMPSGSQHAVTDVAFTRHYAHPGLLKLIDEQETRGGRNDVCVEVHYGELQPRFDLYASGKTLFELMYRFLHQRLRRSTSRNPEARESVYKALERPLHERISGVDSYLWHYLWVIASRLLDGENSSEERIPNLTTRVTADLRYKSSEEFATDSAKMLDAFDLESAVPELDPISDDLVRVAGCRVPLTARVKSLVNHPAMVRLRSITQLGLISLVYPSATHTRFEHSLGTFANVCDYIRALYYDRSNPLFRSVMTVRDLEAVMVAGLLHDLGQYPSCHDIEEIGYRELPHEQWTLRILRDRSPSGIGRLLDSPRDEGGWGFPSVEAVVAVISGDCQTTSCLKTNILHSIVSGPIDADRLDYLRRDSIHTGVTYGAGLDRDWFLSNLTVVCVATEVEKSGHTRSELVAEVGISEKARVSAEMVAFARYAMFTTVYWHHTVRAIKAMLNFAAGRVLKTQRLRTQFLREMFRAAQRKGPLGQTLARSPDELSASETCLLRWLWRKGDKVCRGMVSSLYSRTLYKRLCSLPYREGETEYTRFGEFANTHASWRWATREDFRRQLQRRLLKLALAPRTARQRAAFERMDRRVVVLLDVPWHSREVGQTIRYVHEMGENPFSLSGSVIWKHLAGEFNPTVGKLRVFVHPELRSVFSGVQYNDVERELEGLIDNLP